MAPPARPVATSGPVESCRRKLAWVAVVLATGDLILGDWLMSALVMARVRDGSWAIYYLGPPVLAAMTAIFVTLWRAAERLALPVGSLSHRPDAIRALTGQRHRDRPGKPEGQDPPRPSS